MTLKEQIMKLQTYKMYEGENAVYVERDDVLKALEQQSCYNPDEWCHDCSEYDQEKHCCPRFNRVIRNTVEEMKQPKMGHWISCNERLPEICEKDCHGNITFSKTVLTTQIYGNGFVYVGNDQYTTNNGGWLSEVPFDNPDERCKVIAWMPLPEPYKAESEG
jgi:hypothetical protein